MSVYTSSRIKSALQYSVRVVSDIQPLAFGSSLYYTCCIEAQYTVIKPRIYMYHVIPIIMAEWHHGT